MKKDSKLAEVIKSYRKQKGIMQKDMAKALDMNVSTYSNYENGFRPFPKEILQQIADELDIDLQNLLLYAPVTPHYFISVPTEESIQKFKEAYDNPMPSLGVYLQLEGNKVEFVRDELVYMKVEAEDKTKINFTKEEFEEFNAAVSNYIQFELFKRSKK